MRGWVRKEDLIKASKHPGHIAWFVRKYNKAVPCFIQQPLGSILWESGKVKIRIATDWGTEHGGCYKFSINVPIGSVMFDNRYLKHSFPLKCWPKFQDIIKELKEFRWEGGLE